MKILLLAKDYPPTVGGVENYSKNLSEGLINHCECEVLSFSSNRDEEIDDLIEVKRIRPIIDVEIIKAIQLIFVFPFIYWRGKFDVVYATTWKAALPAVLFRSFFNYPIIIAIHGAEITRHKESKFSMRLMRLVLKTASRIISVSEFTKQIALKYCDNLEESMISVVPNGIHFKNLQPQNKSTALKKLNLSQDSFHLTTISRLDDRKGHKVVIEAIPELLKLKPNLKYIIVGDGPSRPELELLVEKLGVEEHVVFTGFVDFEDLDFYYSVCDLFVLLNTMESDKDFEGFGLVFAEAAYYKKPVIAGKNAGPMEVVVDGSTGFLLEPERLKLIELFRNEDLSQSRLELLGKNAFEHTTTNFTVEMMVSRTYNLIEKTVSQ